MADNINIPLICITGPTATGKSESAIKLARQINGEIINADSVQVYKGLDIGSAKPTEDQLKEIPHHLISHVMPEEEYSAGRFRKEALNCIVEIFDRGKVPIVVGGTGMYLGALFGEFLDSWGFEFGENILNQIIDKIELDHENVFLHKLLSILDMESALSIPYKDNVRVRRALIQTLSTGIPASVVRRLRNSTVHYDRRSTNKLSNIKIVPLIYLFDVDRNTLYEKIDRRVEEMFRSGLLEEVKGLKKILDCNAPSMKAIGYKHLFYLDFPYPETVSDVPKSLIKDIQRDTRRFAKRQMTWWRNQPEKSGWKSIFSEKFFLNFFNENVTSFVNQSKDSVKSLEDINRKVISITGKEKTGSFIELLSRYFVDSIQHYRFDEKDAPIYFARIKLD